MEAALTALLLPLVGNTRLFWDTTPDNWTVTDPCIVIQVVGGKARWFVNNTEVAPSHKHARVQIEAYAKTRLAASNLARLIEDTLRDSTMTAEPIGAYNSTYSAELKVYGTRQQFGIWYVDP